MAKMDKVDQQLLLLLMSFQRVSWQWFLKNDGGLWHVFDFPSTWSEPCDATRHDKTVNATRLSVIYDPNERVCLVMMRCEECHHLMLET